jgi:hypothetical protein
MNNPRAALFDTSYKKQIALYGSSLQYLMTSFIHIISYESCNDKCSLVDRYFQARLAKVNNNLLSVGGSTGQLLVSRGTSTRLCWEILKLIVCFFCTSNQVISLHLLRQRLSTSLRTIFSFLKLALHI